MFVATHFGVGLRDRIPAKTLRHARIKTLLQHQLVGSTRLFEMGKMAALQALLVHPHIADIKRAVKSGGACANHDHAALFANK